MITDGAQVSGQRDAGNCSAVRLVTVTMGACLHMYTIFFLIKYMDLCERCLFDVHVHLEYIYCILKVTVLSSIFLFFCLVNNNNNQNIIYQE